MEAQEQQETRIILTPSQARLVLHLATERDRIQQEAQAVLRGIGEEFDELARMVALSAGQAPGPYRIEQQEGKLVLILASEEIDRKGSNE